MKNILDKFHLLQETEEFETVINYVDKGVVFRGTNLWILIFAIFIASLGLNLNATAVIIGAMLISPLMGPIIGIGLAVGINELSLLRKAMHNYLVATLTGLATSTAFFLISPLNEAHSEILARTSPTIYDVLIAFFGGLAGMLATASKYKGNVIPGVAIATALMPPLCTAGYGLATLRFQYFVGAFYLFIINTVFIAVATYLTVRLLKFPYTHLPDKKADTRANRIIWAIVLITLLPSVYFGYDIVQRTKFTQKADLFIETEGRFPNDYLLDKKIDAKARVITLTYGGQEITPQQIAQLKGKLALFGLADTRLEIQQGFGYLAAVEKGSDGQIKQLNLALEEKEMELKESQAKIDSLHSFQKTAIQIYAELKVQYPELLSALITPSELITGDNQVQPVLTVVLEFAQDRPARDKQRIRDWLEVRLQQKNINLVFQKRA